MTSRLRAHLSWKPADFFAGLGWHIAQAQSGRQKARFSLNKLNEPEREYSGSAQLGRLILASQRIDGIR